MLDVPVQAVNTSRPLAQVEQVAQGATPDTDHVEPATHGAATTHWPPEK